jgi:formylglycine-generating enzyme required for sulfatase activity
LNPEIPATDVTWDEASAYARWAGKRLQSWVEWEYALRGGSRYRPWAGWSEGTSTPHPGDVNSDDRSSTRGPWPGQRGADFTSDTGIAHLSDNVAEWTATVVGAEKRAAAPSALAASPLAPVEDTHDIYWVAGGSFESSTFDFSVADRRRRRWHGPGVGFRCALTATEFARSQGDTSPRVRFRALESHDVTNGYGITQR